MKVINMFVLLFLVIVINTNIFKGQIISWPLISDGNPIIYVQGMEGGVFKSGTGTGNITFSTNGAYTNGWTTNTEIDTSDYFQVSLKVLPGYKLKITEIHYSERRSLTGIRYYQLRVSKEISFGEYQTLAFITVPDNDLNRDTVIGGLSIIVNGGENIYFRWYGYGAESSAGTWRFNANKLKIFGQISIINPNDNTSEALPPLNQVPSDTISSLRTTKSLAKKVFSFTIKDYGTSDFFPTNISSIIVKNFFNNNLQDYIEGVIIKVNNETIEPNEVNIYPNSIVLDFLENTLLIPNSSFVDVDIYIYLKRGTLKDNDSLKFYISPESFVTYLSGSDFNPNFTPVVSNTHYISVQATKINLLHEPLLILPNVYFNLKASLTDEFDNIDLDFNKKVFLNLIIGNYSLFPQDSLIKYPNNGIVSFNIKYPNEDIILINIEAEEPEVEGTSTSYLVCYEPKNFVFDDFEDGELLNNPTWVGNVSHFIVTPTNQLELFYDPPSSPFLSYISTPIKITNNKLEWNLTINLKFSPSNNNCLYFYLLSDNPNLVESNKGIYVKIGKDGSNDNIELFYKENTNNTLILSGIQGSVANNPFVNLRIIKDENNWYLYTSYQENELYSLESNEVFEVSFDTISYTGILCKYTTTNSKNKFIFDNFYAGEIVIDTIPPFIKEVNPINDTMLIILFNEFVEKESAENTSNYYIEGIGQPKEAKITQANNKEIIIKLPLPLINGNDYTIHIAGIKDLASNIQEGFIYTFTFFVPKTFDVLVNEIMADPLPTVNLPPYEYIELYNKTPYEINLKNWKLKINDSEILIKDGKINGNSYIIITHPDAYYSFENYGNVLPVLPSTSILTNSGGRIILITDKGNIMHFVEYSDAWYGSSSKAEGGWSLELIDPNNPCGEKKNWIASKDPNGGTPGKVNSNFKANPDKQIPELTHSVLLNIDTLLLFFSESISKLLDKNDIFVDNDIGNPIEVGFFDDIQKIVFCRFNKNFENNKIYKVQILNRFNDCAGNQSNLDSYSYFGIPDTVIERDIVINEVLIYPKDGGSEYIELFNKSNKLLSLKDIFLAKVDNITNTINEVYPLSNYGFYIFPNDYVVVTKSKEGVVNYYYVPYPNKINETYIPNFNSNEDIITIVDKSLRVIDQFFYKSSMHHPLLESNKGVALERINPYQETNEISNWHSAASTVGYGTPTYKNSQYFNLNITESSFSIEPEIFSPDMDGYNDVLFIKYKLDKAGYMVSINIFDYKGRLVKKLINNYLCGTEGYFIWDGTTDENTKAYSGIYVILIELFNLSGSIQNIKKICVLANKFK